MPDPSLAADATVLVLSGPRLADGRTVDVLLSAGRVKAVGTPGSLPVTPSVSRSVPPSVSGEAAPGARGTPARLNLSGYLLLPAPAEPHAHLDSALTGTGPEPVPGGPAALRRRITEAALVQLGHGATAQRTHIRVGDAHGLAALEAALAARRALRGLATLTTVAAPRRLTGRSGADNRAMLREAAAMGADALGGTPDLDPDPAGYAEAVRAVAEEHGRPLDLHTDAADPARLHRLAAAVAACPGGVTLGPCAGLARLPADVAARAAEQLAAAGVTVACLPQGPCSLAAPGPPPAAPVRLLAAAGVPVTAGSGTLRDAANPVGRGDPLEAAYLLATRGELTAQAAYEAVSARARAALGLPEVRVAAGFPADLLAVRGDTVPGALSLAYSRLVIHQGRVVARTSAVREYRGTPGGAVPPVRPGLPRQATGE